MCHAARRARRASSRGQAHPPACPDRRDDERLHRGLRRQDPPGAQAPGRATRFVAVAVLRCCTAWKRATSRMREWPFPASGWPDLNRRPLRPEATQVGRSRSKGVERGASHQKKRPKGVCGGLVGIEYVGSPCWLPLAPSGGRGATHVNQDRRRFHVLGDRRQSHRDRQGASRRVVGSEPLAEVPRPHPGDHSLDRYRTPGERARRQRPDRDGAPRGAAMTDKLIRITTALAVATVATVAAVISYRHAYELVSTHGETGVTARLVPFTVDGLILAASMLILDANRRNRSVPPLARWCLGAGILATVGANLAHGLGHGPIGALVSAWPALALAGSFELLMTLIRTEHDTGKPPASDAAKSRTAPVAEQMHHLSWSKHQRWSRQYVRGTTRAAARER